MPQTEAASSRGYRTGAIIRVTYGVEGYYTSISGHHVGEFTCACRRSGSAPSRSFPGLCNGPLIAAPCQAIDNTHKTTR
jgi:hypothetical protein